MAAEKVSPPPIQKHLKGADYPASKDALLTRAKEQDAPGNVLSLLERLPDKTYSSAKEVQKAVGDLEQAQRYSTLP